MIYAVIDTNVLVSALITHNPKAATAKVVKLLFYQGFIPREANILGQQAWRSRNLFVSLQQKPNE